MVDFNKLSKLLKERIKEQRMATKTAPAKGKGKSTAIVPWKEKFAQYAKEATEQVKNVGGGTNIKFGAGLIEVGGRPVPGAKMECVIIGSCALNAWNKDKFDKDNPQPPDCYAFAVVTGDKTMAPHEEAHMPQADTCAECEKNQFGSADTGRGKACANTVRLGIITASDAEDADGINSAELATAKVSPTNAKYWAGYVKMLEDEHGRPPWAVVTQVQTFPDSDTQYRVEFKLVSEIDDDDVLEALEKRYAKVQDELQKPFPQPTERPTKSNARPVAKNAKFAGKGKR